MHQIPVHRLFDTVLKIHLRSPANFVSNFRTVYGIASIMPRPIGHGADMLLKLVQVRPTALRNCRTNRMNNVEIGAFFPGADVVKRTDLPFFKYIKNCPAVILYVEPVTNLVAIAIYGK